MRTSGSERAGKTAVEETTRGWDLMRKLRERHGKLRVRRLRVPWAGAVGATQLESWEVHSYL